MKIEEKIEFILKMWESLKLSSKDGVITKEKIEKFEKIVLSSLEKSWNLKDLDLGANTGNIDFDNHYVGLWAEKYFKLVRLALKNDWEDVLCVFLKENKKLGQLYFFNEGGYRTTLLHEAAMHKMENLCLLALEISPKLAEIEDEYGNTFVRCAKIAGLDNVVEKAREINFIYGLSAENKYIISSWKRKQKFSRKNNKKKILEKTF